MTQSRLGTNWYLKIRTADPYIKQLVEGTLVNGSLWLTNTLVNASLEKDRHEEASRLLTKLCTLFPSNAIVRFVEGDTTVVMSQCKTCSDNLSLWVKAEREADRHFLENHEGCTCELCVEIAEQRKGALKKAMDTDGVH